MAVRKTVQWWLAALAVVLAAALAPGVVGQAFDNGGPFGGPVMKGSGGGQVGAQIGVSLPAGVDTVAVVVTADYGIPTKLAVHARQRGYGDIASAGYELVAQDSSSAAAVVHSLSGSTTFSTFDGDTLDAYVAVYSAAGDSLDTQAISVVVDLPDIRTSALVTLAGEGEAATVDYDVYYRAASKIVIYASQAGFLNVDDAARALVYEDSSETQTAVHAGSVDLPFTSSTGDTVAFELRVLDAANTLRRVVRDTTVMDAPYTLTRMLAINSSGWNSDAVAKGYLPAVGDSAGPTSPFDVTVRDDGSGRDFAAFWADSSAATTVRDPRTRIDLNAATTPAQTMKLGSFYFSALDSIPDGATIESAYWILSPDDTGGFNGTANANFHRGILMCFAPDAGWVAAGAGPYGNTSRDVTWNNYDQSAESAWYPRFRSRYNSSVLERGWSIMGVFGDTLVGSFTGDAYDWDGAGGNDAGVGAPRVLRYDVTRAVQFYVDYRHLPAITNGGFVHELSAVTRVSYYLAGVNDSDEQTALVISYSDRPRVRPWGEKPVPFIISTDDNNRAYDFEMCSIMEDFGGKLSMGYTAINIITGGAARPTQAQVDSLAAAGHAFGLHGWDHSLELNVGDASDWALGDVSWGVTDTLYNETSRQRWVTDEHFDYTDTTSSTNAFRTYVYANGGANLWSMHELARYGYDWARMAGASNLGPTSPSWAEPNPGPVTYWSWDNPTNMFAVMAQSVGDIVGAKAVDTDSLDIAYEIRRHLPWYINNGQAAFITLSHGTKASDYTASVMDYDELRWMLSALDTWGITSLETYHSAFDKYEMYHPTSYPETSFAAATHDSIAKGTDGTRGTSDDDDTMSLIWRVLDDD